MFDEMGWEVREAEEGEFPEETVIRSLYTLEIPVRRDAGRRPEWWAVREVEELADDAHLDLRPVSSRMLRRQRCREPHWFVCEARSTHANWWVRHYFNLERRLGFHDTGAVLFGSEEAARQRAGRLDVRPPFPQRASVHATMRRIPVADERRWALKAAVLCWVTGPLGGLTAGPWWLAAPAVVAWILLTWWCATIVMRDLPWRPVVRQRRNHFLSFGGFLRATRDAARQEEDVVLFRLQRSRAWTGALAASGTLFASTAMLAWTLSLTSALGVHLLLAGVLFVTIGIRRLVRAGSKSPFLVAVFAALLPVAIPALGGLSPVLFTFYGAEFDARAEEMDIAQVWQFLASAYVLGVSGALTLVFLACWSYIQPLLKRRTLRPMLPVAAVTWFLLLTLAWMLIVLDSASTAGDEAVRQWRSGRVPTHYYGAGPRPVCVTPIGALDELPLYGHRLHPKWVYGSFGVVNGEVVLWDPTSGDTFSVRAEAVQVLPAGKGESGASIPHSCRA
ncbi:hypothetical protein ACH4RA_23370 [Streptomyces smyrnaeus]|uniref:hypothetical protein n=1 Tax=Streptomyces smyrnaeus TaxID=1387713 RepID=UPI00379A14B0